MHILNECDYVSMSVLGIGERSGNNPGTTDAYCMYVSNMYVYINNNCSPNGNSSATDLLPSRHFDKVITFLWCSSVIYEIVHMSDKMNEWGSPLPMLCCIYV